MFKKSLATCVVLGVAAIAVAGCGDSKPSVSDIPADSVALVGDVPITKEVFNHWYEITVKSQQALFQTKKNKKIEIPPPLSKKGEPFTQQTMQTLIQASAIQQEAAELGAGGVSEKEIDKQLEQAKKQFFGGKAKQFDQFLERSGMDLNDVRFRIELGLLGQDVVEKATEGKDEASEDDIKKFYDKNKQQFVTPKRYNLNVVLTKTKDTAEQAKQQLDDGASWSSVAKEFSKDPASKKNGGKLDGVVEGQYGEDFDKALKKAKKGEIVGPVKTQFGYYVFEVNGTEPAKTTPFDKAKKQIKKNLELQKQTEARQKFAENFQKEWKKVTVCRKGYIVQSCSNAPTPTNTGPLGGAPSGAAPQGGAPQGGSQAPPPPSSGE